jgi:hypothetical protein
MTNTAHLTELGHSPDALAQRQADLLALLRQTAPEVLSDNQINIEKLKELLGEERIAPAEHYELNWAGKTEARREIQKTSSHTLRPDANNPAHAQHMLIEGENLEVLRVLQKSYYGKVKMIYIDPPYNTGNDSFVYPDDYSETLDEYQKRTGEKSAEGYLNKQSLWKKNSKESGQYHSAWLSMMYPRLYLARNLLRDDGVIFISIDDNEAANLKLLCDEIFGDSVVLDFFAGSGTTAHAVMELNVEDGGNRQCISVQMPEVLDETSEAYKAGYRTIADITRARIDKVIAKLKAEHPDKTADLACAHFTLAPSNFKVWRGDVGSADALREQLALFQSAEKAGQPQATDAQTAMLTELLLKHGLGALGVHAVSAPKQVAGVTVHRVLMPDDKHMWLCFDTYTDALKDELVKARPRRWCCSTRALWVTKRTSSWPTCSWSWRGWILA